MTAVDTEGHESQGSVLASGTPRPDFTNEWVWDVLDVPALSAVRFQNDETTDSIVAGDDPLREFRLERDADGWWLVLGPDAEVFPPAFETTALKCGPGADVGCVDLETALHLLLHGGGGGARPEAHLRPARTQGREGGPLRRDPRHAAELPDGDDIMIFDWAFQFQPGHPSLSPRTTAVRGG